MSFTIDDLLALLDLESLEADLFRGRSPQVGWQRVFGGLVVAQALVAASRTAEGRLPHALHGFFLRAGDPAVPIDFAVTRLREGRSFATRQCVVSQRGAPIMTALVSFQEPEAGLEHQVAMPAVPPPDQLPSEADLLARYGALMPPAVRRYLERDRPLESGRWISIGSCRRDRPRPFRSSRSGSAPLHRCPTIRPPTGRCSPTCRI